MVMLVLAIWTIEIVDTVALDDRLQRNGIWPRRRDGLDGVLWAPFLHSDFSHLASNTPPFVVLGLLVAIRGRRHWAIVTLVVALVGGGLTWLAAGSGNHIGASGVVFGYFGALLAAAWFERRPSSLAPAAVVILLYGGLLGGLVPREGISWEGHLFGLVAGVLVTRMLLGPRQAPERRPDVPEPWEADEPWLRPPGT